MDDKMKTKNSFSFSRPPPLADRSDLQLRDDHVSGPSRLFNPTRARFQHLPQRSDTTGGDHESSELTAPKPKPKAQFQWRSRDNRKGRHTLVVPSDHAEQGLPAPTNSAHAITKGILRMFTSFPWWDVSFLVAFFFSVGCALFIMSGLFFWLPLVAPSSDFPRESATAGGVTSFIGGTLFEFGAVLLLFEAINENQTGCFGWELEGVLSNHEKSGEETLRYKPEKETCDHQHCKLNGYGFMKGAPGSKFSRRKWEWWPTWHELRTHYFHELGFLGSVTEIIGATVFWVTTLLSLPGVYNHLSEGVLWGLYWLTYLVGSIFFVISSELYLLETQPNWYTPAPHLLGWWVGFWNMIGSIGWTLAASLGYCNLSGCEYQSDLTLIWASVAFLIASLILWYEALEKYPVEKEDHRS